jgi:hypothetical protein
MSVPNLQNLAHDIVVEEQKRAHRKACPPCYAKEHVDAFLKNLKDAYWRQKHKTDQPLTFEMEIDAGDQTWRTFRTPKPSPFSTKCIPEITAACQERGLRAKYHHYSKHVDLFLEYRFVTHVLHVTLPEPVSISQSSNLTLSP